MHREPGNAIIRAGGSNSRTAPIWQFINGKWYYLSKISGAVPLGSMYREIRTPDGYYVDKDGVWDGLETKEK